MKLFAQVDDVMVHPPSPRLLIDIHHPHDLYCHRHLLANEG